MNKLLPGDLCQQTILFGIQRMHWVLRSYYCPLWQRTPECRAVMNTCTQTYMHLALENWYR